MSRSVQSLFSATYVTCLLTFSCQSMGDYTPATFTVDGSKATMIGDIDSNMPKRVRELHESYPEVTTIVMQEVPGSIDDKANLAAARLVRRYELNTLVPADGLIASGGVDFFLAGVERIVEPNAMLGVHSWAGDDFTGEELPRDNPEHRLYLDYYAEMGIPAEFYWFTLKAAPAEDIHFMTPEEIAQYKITTQSP